MQYLIALGILLAVCFLGLAVTAKNRDEIEGRPFTPKEETK